MTGAAGWTTVRLPQVLGGVGAAGLIALTLLVYLAGDGPWPAATMQRACIALAATAIGGWLWTRPRPTLGLVPYAVYALSLAIVFAAVGGDTASRELWRQIAFVTVRRTLKHYFEDRRTGAFGFHIGTVNRSEKAVE